MRLAAKIRYLPNVLKTQAVGLYVSLRRPSLFRRAWIALVLGVLGLVTSAIAYVLFFGPDLGIDDKKNFSLDGLPGQARQ